MTYEERRMMRQFAERIADLETRVSAQAALLDRLARRKSGRPTNEERSEMDVLLERVNAAAH